jgi:C4-dicarboxylate transporter DctM subunit
LIIYGIATSTSVSDLFIAGIVPGILVAGLLMLASYIVGRKKGYTGDTHKFNLNEFLKSVWEAKWALAMPIVILGGIYGGVFTPTEAAVVGVFIGLVAGVFVYRELTVKDIVRIMIDTGSLVGAFTLMFTTANSLSFIVS